MNKENKEKLLQKIEKEVWNDKSVIEDMLSETSTQLKQFRVMITGIAEELGIDDISIKESMEIGRKFMIKLFEMQLKKLKEK